MMCIRPAFWFMVARYAGAARRREPIDIKFLTDRLAEYLDRFVQSPPYHLVASSLGGQISVEYAARYPEKVGKLVLLCPSGFGTEERLPITEGGAAQELSRPGRKHILRSPFRQSANRGVLRGEVCS